MNTSVHILAAMLALAALACKTETTTPTTTTTAAKVAKIVFVGKADACDCTKKRIADSWAVLEKALGGRQDIPVERLHVDTDGAKVAPFQEIRAVMVIPGVYFLDSSGAIIELLQGELSDAQVTRLL